MCLTIPGKVVATYREHDMLMGKVDFGGVLRRVCLEHVSDAQPGQYVLVHVGFALTRIDEEEAQRVFQFLDELNQLDELKLPADSEQSAIPRSSDRPTAPPDRARHPEAAGQS